MKTFDSIGRYEIQRRLGTGGMGSVYLARDAQLDRLVAIKLLKDDYSDDAELRQRFHREARSIARLRHPNIVTVFDVGEHEGRPFMAMEYIAGDTLTVWLRRSPPPPLPRRLALVEELCAGLAHAHEAGMVHRDIKPNNLMVDADGVLKILDFGIARAPDTGITQAGMMIGSLNYMSPEQVTGGNVDYRADVFAAGVVLYEVIALEQAFSGSLDSGVLHRIMTVGPVPLQERVPGIDSDLVRITERALARDPGDRYQHASEMRKDLAAVRQRLDLDPSATSVLSTPAPSTSSPAPADTRLPRAAMTADRLRELSRQQVEEHVQAARRALDAGDFRLALDRAERSALLEPDNSAVIGLLERVRFEYQAAAVRQALIEAKQLLAEGSLDRAAALVERVPSLSGPEPRATELNDQVVGLLSEIGQAREQQSRRHARERYEEQSRTAGAVKTPPAAGSSPPLRPPSPPPPTAAGDADENAPHIVVRLASHRNSSLPRSEEAVELVGRDRELQALVHRILRSHGGSFLVTGYRGVGKTSFVNGVVRRLDDEARSEPGLRLLIVRINLPKPIEPLMLLKTMLRSLAHELAAADLQQRLAPQLRRQIDEAVERTSEKVVRRVSEDAEAGLGVGDASPGWSPVKLSANVKRARSHSKEHVPLDYAETDIERDLVSLARQLGRTSLSIARPWYRRLWPLRSPRDEAVRVRVVFVFDELDKLEELSLEDGSPATVTMDPVFATLKTLLTESELTFVFVAGRDLQERLERDMRRGDSIYRSVFAGRWYLGCLWSAIDRVYTHHLTGEHDEEQSRALAAFRGYIRYKARGLPRLALDTFEDHVEWGREPCLRFSPVQLRRFRFFAALHAWIEEQFEHSGPIPLDDDGQVDADRSRMAAYYAVDDVLRRGKREFTSDELRASIEALSVKVTPAKADLDRFVSRVIHVLEAGAYIERVGEQGDDRQIWEGPRAPRSTANRDDRAEMRQAPRFRVRIGRLAELGGRAEAQRRAAPGAGDKPMMIQSFEIYEVVGEGAAGVVYRARDLRRSTVAALKVLRPDVADSPAAQARLEREGTVLDRLQHPAIVRLIERGTERGRPYIAMEFVPGLSLKRVLQNRARLDAELAGAVAARLADALQHVHDRGFVRTDLSPRHVMVTPDGELRIIDLGIAKQESVESSLTQVGVVLGTPGYLAPEGWNGLPLDPRSDVYTLGVMLYEMVTGALPFAGSSRGELGLAHLNRKPIPPSVHVQLTESLDAAILRCLEKDREARFPSMAELSASLPRMDDVKFKQQLRALVASDQERIEAVEAFTVYQRPAAAASSPGQAGGEPARTIRVRRAAGDVTVPAATGSRRGAGATRAKFRVVEGGRESMQELVLEGARTIIGRGEFSDIVLPGSGVSRSHAAVFMRGSHCWIEDLNSQNGVFVNDERISEPQRLGRGDRIRIGEFLLQFEPAPDSPNAPQSPEDAG